VRLHIDHISKPATGGGSRYRDTSEGDLAEQHHDIIDAAEKFAGSVLTWHVLTY
jgi:hypothetical protein